MDYLYVLQCIREASPDFVNYIFLFISEVIPKALLVYAAIVFWCVNKNNGSAILLGYTAAYGINQSIKNIACVYRPWISDSRLHVAKQAAKSATGYSFPSGHTVTAASIGGGIGIYLKKISVAILMIVTIILVAFSRNWLGAHTMKDVLTAICVAAVTLIIINLLKYYISRNPGKDTVVMFAGIGIAGIITVILQFKSYPLDYDVQGKILCEPELMLTDCYTALGLICGGLFGWWLERHTIKFSTEASKKQLILRGIIGVASFGIVYLLSDIIFDALEAWKMTLRNPGHMLKSFIVFFYVFYLYPLMFSSVHNKLNKKREIK